ncbi:hypothetical protein ABZY93_27075 [Streptomyces smyrnaeus]
MSQPLAGAAVGRIRLEGESDPGGTVQKPRNVEVEIGATIHPAHPQN